MQGVGFRYYTVRLAERLQLRGWVRNLPDGRVEAVGEGTDEQLEQFEAGLRRGPPMASVTNLQKANILDESSEIAGFRIR